VEFWQRVSIQSASVTVTSTGNRRYGSWATYLEAEARVLAVSEEDASDWATTEQEPYEVQLRGSHSEIALIHRVLVDGEPFDIKRIIVSPPFVGSPVTTLFCVKVTP
jgi:Phage head-tail joining protein